jgi:hypothetical protein
MASRLAGFVLSRNATKILIAAILDAIPRPRNAETPTPPPLLLPSPRFRLPSSVAGFPARIESASGVLLMRAGRVDVDELTVAGLTNRI